MAIDSFESYLKFMVEHDVDDPSLYAYLAQIDVVRVRRLLRHLEHVDNIAPPRKGAASFRSKRSAVKGRIYEKVIAQIVDGVKCFTGYRGVISSTNELDVVVMLGPAALGVPALREWGTHCICECKYHTTHVTTDWVSKLNTVLEVHSARVGLLFSKKGVAPSGNGAKIRTSLQLLANKAQPVVIVPIDWDDLQACLNGTNFLEMVTRRYVEATVGSRKLGLLRR